MRPWHTLAVVLVTLATLASAQQTIHVPSDASTIQAGITKANNGDTVLVAPGTYYENIDFLGKNITVTSAGGPATTIIDGRNIAATVTFKSGESRAATLSDFTIQHGGQTTAPPPTNYSYTGAGILVSGSSPTISANVITQNNCNGISIDSATPLIQGNDISSTQDVGACPIASGHGSAIYFWLGLVSSGASMPGAANAIVIGNTIENNTQSSVEFVGSFPAAASGGAAIDVDGVLGHPLIQNNVIRNNTSFRSGAIEVDFGDINLFQNLIDHNAGPCAPALFLNTSGSLIANYVANNTIVDNVVNASSFACTGPVGTNYGTQVSIGEPGNVFVNNILAWSAPNTEVYCNDGDGSDDPDGVIDHDLFYNPGGPIFSPVCTPGEIGTYGNLAGPPMFVDQAGQDYHLLSSSPAIDAGNNSALQFLSQQGADTSTDFDGNPRVQDATGVGYPIIDMGAYEYPGIVEAAPTTIQLNVTPPIAMLGQQVNFSAQLESPNGVPTGTATLVEDGNPVGAAPIDSSGLATFTSPRLLAGQHTFIATYPGHGPFTPAVSVKVIVYINLYSPTLTLTASPDPALPNQLVTFTTVITSPDKAILSPIVLTDTSTHTILATLVPDSTGTAVFTTSSLAVGNHIVLASYVGDGTHNPAVAQVLVQIIIPADFSISLAAPTLTIETEYHKNLGFTLTSVAGFTDDIALFCSNLPPYASCTFNKTPLNLPASASVSSTVTIDTDAIHDYKSSNQAPPLDQRKAPIVFTALIPLCLMIGSRRRSQPLRLCALFSAALTLTLAMASLSGCSGLYPGHTPPGTYTISVDAYSPALNRTHSATLILTVTK